MLRVPLIIAGVLIYIPVSMYLFWVVHITLDRVIVRHARRYCSRRGFEINRVRLQPAFEASGGRKIKTEFTLVQFDCLDAQKQRRLVLVMAWPLGVRKLVSDEKYPEFYDEQWPLNAPKLTEQTPPSHPS